jgi:hypothetical protein
MRMKSLFFSFLLICTSGNAQSRIHSKLITQEQLEIIEKQIDSELQSKKLDRKKKLIANLLAGREFYQYRFFDKSKKYYQSAITIEIQENKSEAYINLMAIALLSKNKKELQQAYTQALDYYKKNPKYSTESIQYYLQAIQGHLTGKTKEAIKGFYGQFVSESILIELVKNKQYSEALSKLNPERMGGTENTNLETIIYDLLNVKINKAKTLSCNDEYEKYPNAYTYSILVCGLLNDHIKDAKLDPEKLKRAEKYFSEEAQDKAYLLEVLKELK